MIRPAENPKLRGKRVTVMGLGTFGGGIGAVQFLATRGARVVVTDLRSEQELADSLVKLHDLPCVEFHLGGHSQQHFRNAELIVVNPAVRPDNPYIELARQNNIPLTSEMNLFWQHNRGQVVAVTGSNGKSTTTTMIHAMLEASGHRCWLGGNIGGSLLPMVDQIESDHWVVLELSSFQLEDLNHLHASPDVAVVTNFSPNHLDRHDSLNAYREAKQSILRWQTADQISVLNRNDRDVVRWQTCAAQHWFGTHDSGQTGVFQLGDQALIRIDDSEHIIPLRDCLNLSGRHNFQNALAAIAAATAIGIAPSPIQQGLMNFTGLPHRLQFVADIDGRTFYNDSIATTPESVQAALKAFDQPIVLLAGGSDKQVDLLELAMTIAKKTKAVALMGQTAEQLAGSIDQCCSGCPIPHRSHSSLDAAFTWAVAQSAPGDIVLISPGCASYDWFRNFADRGDQFITLVNRLALR